MPTRIAAAAVKCGGIVFIGRTHFECARKIVEYAGWSPQEKCDAMLTGEDGYILDDGQFIARDDAFPVALAAGQIAQTDQHLDDPDANMRFYGKDKPTLDSGMIESYAAVTTAEVCEALRAHGLALIA